MVKNWCGAASVGVFHGCASILYALPFVNVCTCDVSIAHACVAPSRKRFVRSRFIRSDSVFHVFFSTFQSFFSSGNCVFWLDQVFCGFYRIKFSLNDEKLFSNAKMPILAFSAHAICRVED